GMISWTRPLDLEAVALCARVLPSGATVIAGHVEKGPGESLRGKAWILTPSAEQAHTVVEQADAFDDLVVVLEQKILATLSESGLVTRAEAPADLVPPAHERTASYLVALNGLALQLLAHQRLIDPAEMVNQAFAPQQYAELVRAF